MAENEHFAMIEDTRSLEDEVPLSEEQKKRPKNTSRRRRAPRTATAARLQA